MSGIYFNHIINKFIYIWYNIIIEISDWLNNSIKDFNKKKYRNKGYYSKQINKIVKIFTYSDRLLYSFFGIFIFFLFLKKIS
jgi:hypothetical protein